VAGLPPSAEILGPVPDEEAGSRRPREAAPGDAAAEGTGVLVEDTAAIPVRALIRVPRTEGSALARALQAAQATRSPRKDGGAVRVQLDPAELI
jgi:primosomal protein N' (replication factor Y) (superfamily II helicase)